MSDITENKIQLLLNGQCLDNDNCKIASSAPNGSVDSKDTQTPYVPICQKTVTYIVAAIIINDQDEVLMMQEAKVSCSGKWYLPAGRVEKNENLLDAVKREVLEETGLIMEPKTLIMVESASGSWFRFVFTGEITSGSLKTPEQANQESLQACWVRDIGDLVLRSNDIVPLIERCKNYMKNKEAPQHPYLLPMFKSYNKLLLRLVVTAKKKATNKLNVLVSDTITFDLPICEIIPNRSLLSTLHNYMVEIFGADVPQHKPHGFLSVEFSGGVGGDGFCVTLLVSFRLPLENVPIIGKFLWHQLSENVANALALRLPRNMTVPFNVVR